MKTLLNGFENRFNTWLEGAQNIIDVYANNRSDGSNRVFEIFAHVLTVKKNRKYWKVISTPRTGSGASVFAFIDTTNGDVLKPASFKTPAKHARGNIYDDKNGLGSMTPYGPASLKG